MKAGVFTKVKEIEIKDVPKPELKDGEALIKVDYCNICGSDIHVFQGHHPTAKFPLIPGHEFVGELVEIKGENPQNIKAGDLVVAQPVFSCGYCDSCAKGMDNVCQNLSFGGIHLDGAMAEYVKVLTRKVYRMPSDMDKKLASFTEPLAVAVHDVRKSGLQVGETALVIGGGPIGILIALVARLNGAHVVISEISEYRCKFIEEMGFKTVNPLDKDAKEQHMAITGGKGYEVVFEVSGSQPGLTSTIELSKIGATIMIVGMGVKPYEVNFTQVFLKELTLKGVRIHSQYNFIGAMNILKSGVLNKDIEKLISKVYKLDELESALEYIQNNTDFFKVLVEI